jgi:hypothetical protein
MSGWWPFIEKEQLWERAMRIHIRFIKRLNNLLTKLGTVVHACDSSTQEAEAGGCEFKAKDVNYESKPYLKTTKIESESCFHSFCKHLWFTKSTQSTYQCSTLAQWYSLLFTLLLVLMKTGREQMSPNSAWHLIFPRAHVWWYCLCLSNFTCIHVGRLQFENEQCGTMTFLIKEVVDVLFCFIQKYYNMYF